MKFITQKEAKELDKNLINLGFEINSLIELAGRSAFEVIQSIIDNEYKGNLTIVVLIGPGNNGADGLVISRYLKYIGHNIYIKIKNTKYNNLLKICENINIKIIKYEEEIEENIDYVIDAIFGFSFKAPLKQPYSTLIEKYKKYKIISIDVPTGYEIDKHINKSIFIPMAIITFGAPKICCKGITTYIVKSFFPQNIIKYKQNYKNYEKC